MQTFSGAAPGTSTYFPSCLSRIRDANPEFPIEPVILQSILLCLVAGGPDTGGNGHLGRKNLILRTREDDISTVLNLASLILTRVFGITTNKFRAKKDTRGVGHSAGSFGTSGHDLPDELIRKCFFRGKPGSRSAMGLNTQYRDRTRRPGSSQGHGRGPRRSSTFPSASPTIAEASLPSVQSSVAHSREGTGDSAQDAILPRLSAAALRVRPKAPRMETEPSKLTTLRPHLELHAHSAPPQPVAALSSSFALPGALVVSGLEYTTAPAQRTLLQVLRDGRIVLDEQVSGEPLNTWKLPGDFLVIYVCPLDAYERPPILTTLLDRFAMSVDVALSPSLRQTYMAYHSTTATPLSGSVQSLAPHSPLSPVYSPDSTPMAPSPRLRPSPLAPTFNNLSHGSSSSPIIPAGELSYLRSLTAPAPAGLHQASLAEVTEGPDAYTSLHPTLNIYLADLFAASRHHPLIDGTLLTLRAHRDAEDLVRAFRVICGDSLGAELVTTMAATSSASGGARDSEDTDSEDLLLSPADDVHNIDWANPEDEWLGSEVQIGKKKASSVRSLEVKVTRADTPHAPFERSSANVSAELLPELPQPPEVWDVSEVDVGKIFPRVVSHRMRVRAGPHDEILGSVMFPAAHATSAGGPRRGAEDRTVKQVIISILADV